MNIVDSSGWLEYFADGPMLSSFLVPQKAADLVVPTTGRVTQEVRMGPPAGRGKGLSCLP